MDVQFDPFTLTYGLLMDENADKDCKENEWEFRSLNYDAGDTKIPEAIPLEPHEIDNWVERTTSMIKPPGLDLLLARHQRFGSQDIPSKWFPLRPARMRRVFRGLSLHEAFFDMRVLSAQAGGMNFYTSRNEKNEVTELNFLIRPAHSSHFQYSSNWSWAFTWNACTGRMTGFLDGMTDQDIDDLKLYLKSASPELGHPLMLPELLLSLIYKHLNVRIRIPAEQDYFAIERGAGISRVQSEGTVWDWSPERFQDSTKKANTFMTTLAYLQGRFPFARQLAERMAKTLKRLETEEFADSTIKERLITGRAKRAERLENWLYQFQTATNQVACMQKRGENTITVLNSVLNQLDTRSQLDMTKNQSRMGEIQVEMGRNQLEMAEANVQIAQAVRNDSIPMRTIAYVTLVLLPGTFIAAIFGMNFFQFDTPSRTLIVAKSIWQYFVIAIPITIITIIIWNYWVRLETKKDARLTGDSRRFSTARNENIVAILEPTSSHEILPAEVAMKSRSGIQEFVRRLSGNKQTVDVELSPVS